MAAQLERCEYKIWKLFFAWSLTELPEDFEITYMKEFNLRDRDREIERITRGMALVPNPLYQAEAQREIVSLTLEDDETIEAIQQSIVVTEDPDGPGRGVMTPGETHPSPGEEEEQQIPHIQEMIANGYTDAEILALHPEIDAETIDEIRHQLEGTD